MPRKCHPVNHFGSSGHKLSHSLPRVVNTSPASRGQQGLDKSIHRFTFPSLFHMIRLRGRDNRFKRRISEQGGSGGQGSERLCRMARVTVSCESHYIVRVNQGLLPVQSINAYYGLQGLYGEETRFPFRPPLIHRVLPPPRDSSATRRASGVRGSIMQ